MTQADAPIRNPAKEKLQRGEAVLAFNVFEALRPSVAKIAAQLGIDLLLVETEHVSHNPETLTHFLVLARDNGLAPIVTIPTVTRPIVSGLLDAGALGFCLCHAETPEQVAELVRWAKYPPLGERALAHAANADYRITDVARYCAAANQATLLLLKIESRKGIANAGAMLAIEGIDGVVFGPGDLAADMGLHGRWQDPALLAAMEGVAKLALARRLAVEPPVGPTDQAEYQRQRAAGYRIFGPARVTEYDHLRAGALAALAPFR
ncbi:MAG: hypothetical protein FJX68_13230 [Alphaproteobacteria bacterium]|nr:hypothetical protein [Alphaproteobacteria bacterium]